MPTPAQIKQAQENELTSAWDLVGHITATFGPQWAHNFDALVAEIHESSL